MGRDLPADPRLLTPWAGHGKVGGMIYALVLFIASIVALFVFRPVGMVLFAIAVIVAILVLAYRLVLKAESEGAAGDGTDEEQ
jgi:hypothetical protein